MDPKLVKTITTQIYRRYPEFEGCRPKVRRQAPAQAKSESRPETYLLTYTQKVQVNSAAGPRTLTRSLRVVTDANGKILKITTSR